MTELGFWQRSKQRSPPHSTHVLASREPKNISKVGDESLVNFVEQGQTKELRVAINTSVVFGTAQYYSCTVSVAISHGMIHSEHLFQLRG